MLHITLTDPNPAEAPGAMSLRKMEGPLGTADLPEPEATRKLVLNQAPEVAPGIAG